jgi:hypothetical protein
MAKKWIRALPARSAGMRFALINKLHLLLHFSPIHSFSHGYEGKYTFFFKKKQNFF